MNVNVKYNLKVQILLQFKTFYHDFKKQSKKSHNLGRGILVFQQLL